MSSWESASFVRTAQKIHKAPQPSSSLVCQDLGIMAYREAWTLQDDLRQKRIAGEIADQFFLVEHPPVFTIGARDSSSDFLVPQSDIVAHGIEIVKTNRGGRVTYHGPGQIVGYFIVDHKRVGSIPDFVRSVEEVCLRTLADFGIVGERSPEHPGIWVGVSKIAAIGLNFSHGVSQHGFALNVNPNLDHYRFIIPCGIRDRGVTSMQVLLGSTPDTILIKQRLCHHVSCLFKK